MSAAEGVRVAGMTVATLQSLRSDAQFDAFWHLVATAQENVDVDEPTLPRRRKMPNRIDEGIAPPEFPKDCRSYYHQSYFEALDLVINAIQDRFDQPNFNTYSQLEELLLKTILGDETKAAYNSVCKFYKNDFDHQQLQLHLHTLCATFPDTLKSPSLSVNDVKGYICSLSLNERLLMNEVLTLLKLILVLPSTNAASERSFSAMRHLKTYLRTTMKQERLNHLLLLHVYKDHTDNLSCVEVAKSFVGDSEYRLSVFGRFVDQQITTQVHVFIECILFCTMTLVFFQAFEQWCCGLP